MFVLAGLTVFVDKRITLGAFKFKLEPFVQVQAENFKVSTEMLYVLLRVFLALLCHSTNKLRKLASLHMLKQRCRSAAW